MPGSVFDEIRSWIQAEGPMPFERYMALALYHPEHGFFGSGKLRSGRHGDFLTSPEVSPLFGHTLAAYVTDVWDRLGRPSDFVLCEAGAGSGSLLAPLLDRLEFAPDVYAIEVSPAAREVLTEHVPSATLLAADDELAASLAGVVIANELLDNLPMALAVRDEEGWGERWVTVDAGALALVRVAPRPAVVEWLDAYAGPVPAGGIVEVQLEATAWVERMVGRLDRGSLVVFDYGDTAEGLAHRRGEGTLRTYRGHHLGPHPLDEPGSTDITADVNFTAAQAAARAAGGTARLLRQADFLTRWGLTQVRDELRSQELALASAGDTYGQLVARTRRTEAETLLHPRGLGGFMVLMADK